MRGAALVFLALLGSVNAAGCDRADRDRDAYLEAFRDPGACARITRPALRGECVAMAAGALAAEGDEAGAVALCDGLESGAWRHECHFLVADHLGVQGDAARAACARAGDWAFQCLGHAIEREARALFLAHPVGQEEALMKALQQLVAAYIQGGEAVDKPRRMLVQHIASRRPEEPFTLESCGAAPQPLCRDAYAERVRTAANRRSDGGPDRDEAAAWRVACGKWVSVERVGALGLPVWAPDAEPLALEAWEELCAR